jgi:hypothetical protein
MRIEACQTQGAVAVSVLIERRNRQSVKDKSVDAEG